MIYILCYDISNNKRRYRTSCLLEGFGIRIQESVFECRLSNNLLNQLVSRLSKIITDKDTLRIYPVCKECYGKSLGIGEIKPNIIDKGYAVF